jgi:hypothetical protein
LVATTDECADVIGRLLTYNVQLAFGGEAIDYFLYVRGQCSKPWHANFTG